MLLFLLIAATEVALARAAPEAGYSYSPPPQPARSYGSPSYSTPNTNYGVPNLTPLVHKHIYVHVPPPESEYIPPQVVRQTAVPQKHYKIVFIKAPSAPSPTAPIIPALAQNQEKTLIYVLVKRPEDAPEIKIPTVAPTQPSKPEVYFIRYKTQKQISSTGNTYGPPDEVPERPLIVNTATENPPPPNANAPPSNSLQSQSRFSGNRNYPISSFYGVPEKNDGYHY